MASTERDKPYSPLDQKQLRRLFGEGLLPESVFRTFHVESTPEGGDWHLWLRNLLLVVGAALVLAGLFIFFAWNWGGMRPSVKFTLLETGLTAAVLAAMLYGRHRTEGKLFLFIASLITGVLLVLCGQVYQTGADAWELLAGWSLLIFGWVAVGRSALLWAFWLGLVHVAVFLFWIHIAGPAYGLSFAAVGLSLATIDILFLILREQGWSRGLAWLQEKWTRPLLLALSLFFLCLPIMEMILSGGSSLGQILCVPAWLLLAGGGYIRYRRRLQDVVALGLIIASGCLLLSALIGRLLLAGGDGEGSFIIFALLVLMITGAGALWLRTLAGDASAAKEWAHD
jgi:uncharacterized membrane protein